MREVELPSGAMLQLRVAPFKEGKELYQALLNEMKSLKIEGTTNLDYNFLKDLFATGFSSKAIDAALSKCMQRSTINNVKISDDLFEPEEARQDYIPACIEVVVANVLPFMKALSVSLLPAIQMIQNIQAQNQKTTT